jgi:hypothetical protein
MKKNTTKKLATTFSILTSLLLVVTPVLAADLPAAENSYEVTSDVLDSFDPLKVAGSPHAATLSTPGGIISRLLEFVFPLAGFALFIMIVAGGLQILAGATNAKGLEEGKKRVTMAIVGFLILFASYWIAQILEVIFGINIV